jgi:hypothetical protein
MTLQRVSSSCQKPSPKDVAEGAAASGAVGTPGPALSSRRCVRMEAWGDVCVYKSL